jgi:large subunit ribosomal protein L3
MKFILATKTGMTQTFAQDGRVVPCTVVQAGPCVVTAVRSDADHGYQAVQVGFGRRKHVPKPLAGVWRKLTGADGKPASFRWVREFRAPAGDLKTGDTINVANFQPGDTIRVVGTTKGQGFQGVVKRHGFHGQKRSHGHKDQERMPGSIGSTGPQRVFKGVRMGGRMGGERVTVTNLSVVSVDAEKNELYIRGAVPGANGGLLLIAGDGDMAALQAMAETPVEETVETPAAEVAVEEAAPAAEEVAPVAETPEAAPEEAPAAEVSAEAEPAAEPAKE